MASGIKLGDLIGRMFNGYVGNIANAIDLFTNGWFEYFSDVEVSAGYVELELSAHEPTYLEHIIASPEYDTISALPNGWLMKCPTASAYDCEREVHKMAIMEMINMFGVPTIYYSVSFNTNHNKIWGEDNDSFITSAFGNTSANGEYGPFENITQRFDVMVYYELPDETMISQVWGASWADEIIMYCSKEHFNYVTSGYLPSVGDIIRPQYTVQHYEITYVKDKIDQFLQDQHIWEIHCIVMKDERKTLNPSLSATEIAQVINQADIFDVANTIDTKKTNIVISDNPQVERIKNINLMGGW